MGVIQPFTIGPAGPAGADGADGADGTDGTSAPDWVTDVPLVAEWTTASAYGAATSVHKRARELGVQMATNKAQDGTTDTDGNRVQGLLRAVAAGDFVLGMRVAFNRPGVYVDTTSTAIAALVVFVDGTDVDTASWYGVGNYYSGVGFTSPTLYRFKNESGANRFETYDSGFAAVLAAAAHGAGPYDVFFVRTGTTLDTYVGPAGGVPQLVSSSTVTGGAGLFGLRMEFQIGVGHDMTALIMGYSDELEEVPW